jgi:hypothetical protein
VKPNYRNFWRRVTNDGKQVCALAGVRSLCWGPKDAHHYFPKQRIDWRLDGKRGYRSIAAKQDVRNGVCLCRLHHDMVHQAINPISCPEPELYGLFLVEHGLHDHRRAKEAA